MKLLKSNYYHSVRNIDHQGPRCSLLGEKKSNSTFQNKLTWFIIIILFFKYAQLNLDFFLEEH